MCGRTLNTEDSLYGLFLKDGVAETGSDVGELLFVGPLDLVGGTLIVIVVVSLGPGIELLLEINVLSLGDEIACWLSPSVVVLEELIVQMSIVLLGVLDLVEALGNVALGVKVIGSDLCDVQIYQVGVVTV